jgi:DNA-binding response OmpR family regulator
MPDQFSTSQVIRFATFEVDLQAQELRKGGLRLKLSGQPFQVLAILLEQPGVVVTREELQKRLWPEEPNGGLERYILRRRSPIAGGAGERRISSMLNGW